MIDQDALEEEPIGALIREVCCEHRDRWAPQLRQIADEADRREREWRNLYGSMKQQRDKALATLAILNGGDFEKDFEEMKRIAEGRNG